MRSVIYRLRQDAYGLVIHRRWLQKGAFRVDGKRFICFAANYLVKETIQTCARNATVTPNWILNRKMLTAGKRTVTPLSSVRAVPVLCRHHEPLQVR
jgi:hypothetical protein